MKLLLNRIFVPAIAILLFVMSGCNKTKPYDVSVAPAQAHFTTENAQIYSVVTDPAPVFNLQVGTTDVSTSDRTVTYTVTSPTGAVPGDQYTIDNSGTVTIPAGKSIGTIDIRGNYASYTGVRKDTLIFTLSTPSLEISAFMDTIAVVLTGCSEGLTNLDELTGDYNNTNETFGTSAYGPYTTSISSFVDLSPTSGSIVVENIFDDGWGPITFLLDWSDPNNTTAIVVPQNAIAGSDAGAISSTYAGQTVSVAVPVASLSATPGTFSYCRQTFTLKMMLGVTGVTGFFNALYTVNMAR